MHTPHLSFVAIISFSLLDVSQRQPLVSVRSIACPADKELDPVPPANTPDPVLQEFLHVVLFFTVVVH